MTVDTISYESSKKVMNDSKSEQNGPTASILFRNYVRFI